MRLLPCSFRNPPADGVQIDRRTRTFRFDHRGDRRRGVRTGSHLVAVEDDERLADEVGQVGACQLAQYRALVLKRLDQASTFAWSAVNSLRTPPPTDLPTIPAGSRRPLSIQFWSSRGFNPADSQSWVVVMQSAS